MDYAHPEHLCLAATMDADVPGGVSNNGKEGEYLVSKLTHTHTVMQLVFLVHVSEWRENGEDGWQPYLHTSMLYMFETLRQPTKGEYFGYQN